MAKRKKDEEQENQSNPSDSENFGLPDLEYKPLERNESNPETEQDQPISSEPVQEPAPQDDQTQSQYEYVPPVDEKSKAPVVISIVIGLVLILSAFFIYNYVYKPSAEKEKQELAEAARKKKAEADRQAKLGAAEEERKRKEAEELAAKNAQPVEGTIETLSARTGRWYVVVTSAVDGDLIMDYAKKQSAKGKSSKIIPPYGKWKFHRLAISDYDTYAIAQTNADAAKAEYGNGVWVIKY